MTNPVFLWLSWLPCVLILTFINTHFASSKCLDDQRSLLLQLKGSLVFNHLKSTKLVTWNKTLDCCEWNGVHCDDSTGHVIGIDLSGESITDSSDNLSSLFSLQFLQRLNLANNSLKKAEIPSGIGELSSLVYLNLSNAGYSGQVPLEITQLVKLEVVDLSCVSSYLLGISPLKLENTSLAMLIRNMKNVRELYLNGVVTSAEGSEWCNALSTSLPNLQVLSLSNCNLSGEIDESLGNLLSLSVIRLDQNNLGAPVPDFIANFRNLTQLKLSNCQLKGTFPQQILQVSTLRSVDLSFNELLEGTLPEFPKNGSLQTLVLSSTNFSGFIPVSVGYLKHLRRIELTNCNFNGSIPPSIASLYRLEYLEFSHNFFSGQIPSFSSVINITNLGIGNNLLGGTLASTDWASLFNLVDLDLSYNEFNGSIPMNLFSLPSLLRVQLSQNGFSGKLEEFSNISSSILDTLDLSNNNLEGPIPKSLFRFKDLKVLALSSNNFTGYLNLNEIQQLKNLSTLDLSRNSLFVDTNDSSNIFSLPQLSTLKLGACNLGVLPEFLRHQSQLLFLDLSDNHIQGRIPKWIWTVGNGSLTFLNLSCNNFFDMEGPLPDTPYLTVLDLHANKLQGEILPLSTSSTYLDYSTNKFTSISPNIGNSIRFTYFLSFSGNSIAGDIPKALCKAKLLQVLDLSNNLLNGKIPDCVIKLAKTLGVLNLNGNQLNDTIPDVFPENCVLSTINFGGNSLQGQVPRSMTKCKQLEVLDLGKNQLRGMFPCWFKNLSHLRVLVLRSNNFYGTIVCSSSNMTWPVLQIVDLASNNFNGEIKAECFTKLMALMVEENNPQSSTMGIRYQILRYENFYYQNVLVVTFKGIELHLIRVLTLFRSIDLSSNKFEGSIPKAIGDLEALVAFNLSHNALSGSIPSSIGNLSMLESLDLSHNNLTGRIPPQLAKLSFLEYLNLSDNKLEGMIPKGTQLLTFDASSYIGNAGLCGPPLSNNCSVHNGSGSHAIPSAKEQKSSHAAEFDWQFILLGIGFGTGAGLVIAPFMFWKKGRKWLDEQTDNLASAILSAFEFSYAGLEHAILGSEEDVEHLLFEIRYDENDDEDEVEDRRVYGRYCLFCSKLDMERRRVIHNLGCTCHGSPCISALSPSK